MAPKGGNVVDLSEMMARLKTTVRSVISSVTPSSWMSPGQPIPPSAPAGTPARAWDFPVGVNTRTKPRATAKIDFATLRGLAETCDILRLVIETRKDQLEAMDWQIKPRVESSSAPDDPRIAEIQAFFQKPDKRMGWNGWLRSMLEDLFVLDAVAIEKRRDRKGKLYALDLLDGSTVAIKLDDTGRMPMAPDVAFQQVIKGVPAVEFSADELLYAMRNPRTDSPYGRSPVEQIISTVDIAIRRAASQLSYYTDGNINTGISWMPKEWSADTIKGFQAWWESTYTATDRHKMKFLPGDRDSYQQIVQPPLKDQYDEWLARVICFAFSISPQPFVAQMNRATADTAHQAALEEGLAPIQRWVKLLIDQIITEEFGAADLEFAWIDDREIDPKVAAEIADIRVKNGTLTVNEVRAEAGQDPYENGIGNAPAVLTMSGYVALPTPDLLEAQHAAAIVGAKNAQKAPAPGEGDEQDEDGDLAEKAARSSLKKKYADPLSTAAAKAAITAIHSRVQGIFDSAAHHVASQLRGLHVLGKADGDDAPDDDEKAKAKKIADDLNLFDVRDLKTISSPLSDVFADAQSAKLNTIGIDVETGLFGQINHQATSWAADHAAALVTQITDTTRDQLRATIAQGYADGLNIGQIADRIAASDAFSETRASLIANTETAMASGEGSIAGFRRARDLGIKLKKQWLDDPLACVTCRTNADAGPIGIDEAFPGGTQTVPQHPRCSCDVISVIED